MLIGSPSAATVVLSHRSLENLNSNLPVKSISNIATKINSNHASFKQEISDKIIERYIKSNEFWSAKEAMEVLTMAKKWDTQDLKSLELIEFILSDLLSETNKKISDISPKNIYLHRAQERKHTNLITKEISNNKFSNAQICNAHELSIEHCKSTPKFSGKKMMSYNLPHGGINFMLSVDKELKNPYCKDKDLEITSTVYDVLKCGGKIHQDLSSNLLGAVIVELPHNSAIRFHLKNNFF